MDLQLFYRDTEQVDNWMSKQEASQRRQDLEDSLQQFSRDVDEIEAWISEKLQTATDESYKDPTNIQVSLQLDHSWSTAGPARPV
uniref:Uncharacterized protein n=1 Tax=Kryptolebias marmoratus TaxID=37003 RepID=A0A3Q2ZLY1_KRYMA